MNDYLCNIFILVQSCRLKKVLVRVQFKTVDGGVEKEEDIVPADEVGHCLGFRGGDDLQWHKLYGTTALCSKCRYAVNICSKLAILR